MLVRCSPAAWFLIAYLTPRSPPSFASSPQWPAASLLGFDGATADVNNLGSRYPTQGGLRPGAPSYVMALCYQKVQDLAPAV